MRAKKAVLKLSSSFNLKLKEGDSILFLGTFPLSHTWFCAHFSGEEVSLNAGKVRVAQGHRHTGLAVLKCRLKAGWHAILVSPCWCITKFRAIMHKTGKT